MDCEGGNFASSTPVATAHAAPPARGSGWTVTATTAAARASGRISTPAAATATTNQRRLVDKMRGPAGLYLVTAKAVGRDGAVGQCALPAAGSDP